MRKLLEKKAIIISEMEGLLNNAETEVRALDNDEIKKYDELKTQLEALVKTIAAIQENKEITKDSEQGVKVMENEQRSYTEELRALTTTGATGSQVVQTTIENEIINKVYENSGLFNLIPRTEGVKGDLEFIIETTENDNGCAFLGETDDALEFAPEVKKVVAGSKRIGKVGKISKKLVLSNEALSVNTLTDKIAENIARGIEYSLLKKGEREAKELTHGIYSVEEDRIVNASGSTLDIVDLMGVVARVKASKIDGSVWIVSREIFAQLQLLQDKIGKSYLVTDYVNGKVQYMLLGYRVLVSEFMEDDTIAFVNPNAFRAKINEGLTVIPLDTQFVTQGLVGTYVEMFCDIVLVDEEKVTLLNLSAPTRARKAA